MSAGPAASLTAALLVTRGNAQVSRGLAQPTTLRPGLALHSIDTRDHPPTFVPPPAPPDTAFTRLTLRVDETQRLRLRLAAAHLGKSTQVILTEALDHYFKRVLPAYLHDPCPCIEGGSAIGGDCCQRNES